MLISLGKSFHELNFTIRNSEIQNIQVMYYPRAHQLMFSQPSIINIYPVVALVDLTAVDHDIGCNLVCMFLAAQ